MAQRKFNPSFRIFRGKKSKDGAASTFDLSRNKDGKTYLFLQVAKQVGETPSGKATFSWRGSTQAVPNGSVTVCLGEADIGEFLAVISGRKNHVGAEADKGLYHQSDNSKASIKFSVYEKDNNPVSFALAVSSKRGNDAWVNVSHLVSFGEAECLREFLLFSLREVNQWSMDGVWEPEQTEESIPA